MIRTRFAPSPTGYMHIGGIRTALFACLVAHQAEGRFILRLEDTDKKREVEGSEAHIIKCLRSLNIIYDEGPDIGGPYAPYRQSERLDSYKKWGEKLIAAGRAYADPYIPEEVQKFREEAERAGKPFRFRDHRPTAPVPDGIGAGQADWFGKVPLRFRSDPKDYTWHDAVMGEMSAGADAIDDFILIKSDGYPTYNFSHIVDDIEMECTHIIRGQEFVSSMPNYLNLYDALGIKWPVFAHVPHILNETGNKKLGKRDGAKDAMEYLRDGILVEALVNFIASMGWNDGTEQEIFSMDELIAKFSLDRVQRSGARFDEKRLIWMNSQWIKRLSLDELYVRTCHPKLTSGHPGLVPGSNQLNVAEGDLLSDWIPGQARNDRVNFWGEHGQKATPEQQKEVLAVVQDRLKTLADLPSLSEYFFARPEPNWQMIDDDKQLKKLTRDEQVELLKSTVDKLESLKPVIARNEETKQSRLNELRITTYDVREEAQPGSLPPDQVRGRDDGDGWTVENIQAALNELLVETNSKPPILFSLIRYALTWAPFSPGLPETMTLLGRDETIARINAAITNVNSI